MKNIKDLKINMYNHRIFLEGENLTYYIHKFNHFTFLIHVHVSKNDCRSTHQNLLVLCFNTFLYA
jgi:hypothetical protein